MIETVQDIRQRLPTTVYELAIRLGAKPDVECSTVKIRQTGQMKEISAANWMKFSATQTMSTRACEFDWRARTGPLGIITIRDAFLHGQGHLTVKALGLIPITTAPISPQLSRGELMRYLAEIAWAPGAILHNRALRWRQYGPDRMAVSAGSGDAAAEVLLNLDSEGRIAGAFAPDRGRSVKPPYLLTPWRGSFSDYRRHQDVWLPFAGEVGWEIDGQLHVYFQCLIQEWQSLSTAL